MLSRRQRASMHYARKRRLSLAAEPRLFRTSGDNRSFKVKQLLAPITFRTEIDLGLGVGSVFTIGTSFLVERNAVDKIRITWFGDVLGEITTPISGNWDFVVSILPGTGHVTIWNQYEQILSEVKEDLGSSVIITSLPACGEPACDITIEGTVSVPKFANLGEKVIQGDVVVRPLGVYGFQIPRHFRRKEAA